MAESNARASVAKDTTDRELIITRVFDAPRELVFDAWTDPKHIAHWWGPTGFTNTIYQMDVRPGGVWRFIMHGPDGTDYKNKIVYVEIARPDRLVYLHSDDDDNAEGYTGQFEVTVTFTQEAGKTRVTMHMLLASAAELEKVKQFGAVEGANQHLARLSDHLAMMVAGGSDASDRELVITRVFNAPREVVFKAWTDPERVKRWWGPAGFTNPVCEIDPRPGGAIRIHMRAPDGVVYPMTGVYREIVAPERLVFLSAALDEKGNPLFEILNTVTFAEFDGGKTKLTLRASVGKTTAEAPRYLAGMEQGWSQTLVRLAEEVRS